MGGGVALAIKQAGGNSIENEARAHGQCPVGDAFLTTAGSLPFKAIIHAPTMKHPAEPIPAKHVELATVAALRCADDNAFHSVALPALGTGIGQVDIATAAKIMLETVQMFRSDNTLQLVEIWLHHPNTLAAFQTYVQK
jgi:O-acetyl-ADP-ribose deacetylase (regulator of RNase III)